MKKYIAFLMIATMFGCSGENISEVENVGEAADEICLTLPTAPNDSWSAADLKAPIEGNFESTITTADASYAGRPCPLGNYHWEERYVLPGQGALINFTDPFIYYQSSTLLYYQAACEAAHVGAAIWTGEYDGDSPYSGAPEWSVFVGQTKMHGVWNGFAQRCDWAYDTNYSAIPNFAIGYHDSWHYNNHALIRLYAINGSTYKRVTTHMKTTDFIP